VIDTRREDLTEQIMAITDGLGVDLFIDPVAGPGFKDHLELLAPVGMLVLYGIVNPDTIADPRPYLQGAIKSKRKFAFQYGKIEIRAKLEAAKGAWPAFWMLGRNWGETAWPECGEIDIMEHVGYDPTLVHGTIHTKAYNHVLKTQKAKSIAIDDPYGEYHIYGLEWTPEKIDISLDGKVFNSFKNEHKTTAEWPFDQPFHLKIVNTVGGAWGGQKGIDDSIFPQQLQIDYVRVYQKK
jgi:beta-glucanase (GH16 family)